MARLSIEEVQERKQGLLKGKELLKDRNGEKMFDNLLDYIDTIEALQQENEQLKESLNDLQLYSLKMQNGEIDMKVTGENAKIFVNSLIQFLKQNGGKNFVTTTGLIDDEKYEVTVRKCNGLTPGEKLTQLEQENEQLRAQIAREQEVLKQAREALEEHECGITYTTLATGIVIPESCECCKDIREVLAEIDKVLGGKEDV